MLERMHPFIDYKVRKTPFWLRRRTLGGFSGLALIGLLGALIYHPFSLPFWPQTLPAVAGEEAIPPELVWGISWHPERVMQDPEGYRTHMQAVSDLGVGLLRFDVHWQPLQPEADRPLDASRFPYYQTLIADAKARGLQVKVNLGGYPQWALKRMQKEPEAFFALYRPYAEAVIEALGPQVDYYQLGNEFNTVLDPIPMELDGRVFREAREVIDAAKERWPSWGVKTVINVCDTFYLPWKEHLEAVLEEASDAIDVIGYDFYPGNYSHLHDWSAWERIDYLSGLMERYGKEGAICETGCPTFLGERRQARWIAESARALQRAIARSPARDRFRFAIFYELADDPQLRAWPPPTENYFGLLATDGRRKPGYFALQQVVGEGRR